MPKIQTLVLSLAAISAAFALQAAEPPAGGAKLFDDPKADALMTKTMPGFADAVSVQALDSETGDGERILRVETLRDVDPPWAIQLHAPLTRAVKKGEVGLVHFKARTLSSADETGAGRLWLAVQRGPEDYDRSVEEQYSAAKEWQDFYAPFKFAADSEAGKAELNFCFGFKRQVVELKQIEILGYGDRLSLADLPRTRFTYAGREPDAAWRKAALDRIEKVRKGDFAVVVHSASGSSVAGAKIQVDQIKSTFQWGTALQFGRLVSDTPENVRYRQVVTELFNAASPENDLKWPAWDLEWPEAIGHEKTLAALRWLNEKGFYVRGHVLVWPGWRDLPKSILKLRDEKRESEIPAAVVAHIRDETLATKGLLKEWDVLNEPFDHRDLSGLFGREIMTDWFRTAHECLPGVPLFLNDYSNHDFQSDKEHCEYFAEIADYLKKSGAPIGGLGVQGHIGSQPNPPENVLAALDRYAVFGLPIRITEFDINSSDDELQADYTRDFFILAFSHPSVVGIQLWGFWENAHWRPKSAMLRADWSEKPNAKVYRDLVLRQWRTHLEGVSDSSGRFAGRGFQGNYVVRVEYAGKQVEKTLVIAPGSPAPTLDITLP